MNKRHLHLINNRPKRGCGATIRRIQQPRLATTDMTSRVWDRVAAARVHEVIAAALARAGQCGPTTAHGEIRDAELQHRPGQAIVEAAIIIPILLLLIFGAIDAVQIALANYHLAQATEAAVHEAALVGGPATGETHEGALASATGSIAEQARLILDAGLGTSSEHATIHITCQPVGCPRYAAITVEITYSGEVWAPLGPFDKFRTSSKMTRATEQDRGFSPSASPPPTTNPIPGGGASYNRALQIPGAGANIPGGQPDSTRAEP